MMQQVRTLGRLFLASVVMLAAGMGSAAASDDKVTAEVKASNKVTAEIKNGTLNVAGTDVGERIVLRLRLGDPTVLEVVTLNGILAFDRETFAGIDVRARDGDDLVRIDDTNGIFTDTEATILRGGRGHDDLRGGAGAETLRGGARADEVDGNAGNDEAFLGSGDDSFTWDPGDGSDRVEGRRGIDTMIFNGSDGSEIFEFLANGERLKFTRDLGNIVMDVDGVERVDLETLGGTDQTTVNDLSGTNVKDVNVDLESVLGGGAADGTADTVTVNATDNVDIIDVAAVAGEVHLTGLTATVRIAHADPLMDQLVVNTLAGVDQVTVGAGVAALIGVTVNQ